MFLIHLVVIGLHLASIVILVLDERRVTLVVIKGGHCGRKSEK